MKAERKYDLVGAAVRDDLLGDPVGKPVRFVTTVNRQGVVFLWPLKLPGDDGRTNPWMETALIAAAQAKTAWCRVTANTDAGVYDVALATGNLPDPVFPTAPFQELLRVAFRKYRIDTIDHPVLRQLRGES